MLTKEEEEENVLIQSKEKECKVEQLQFWIQNYGRIWKWSESDKNN